MNIDFPSANAAKQQVTTGIGDRIEQVELRSMLMRNHISQRAADGADLRSSNSSW